ncbi:FAD-dependent oxidoreductase [Nocardioides sp.]|uniref:FAD-dependent oxidoreductase n=1 Tax=Nocardioides sp. TaxID=35761 RepID=UPI00356261E0
MRYDAIVVGAGPAGLTCATEMAGRGGRVLLLEAADRIGGALHLSGGHLSAAGTRRQRERGIEDTAEAHYADIVRISFGTAETDLVRLAVEHAGETVDLLDAAGFEFAPETPRIVHGHEPYSVPRTYYGIEHGRSVLKILRRQLEESTAEVRLSARVTALLIEDGVCVGVRVGAEEIRAASTVLCTGGFGADPDLFAELEGAPLVSAAAPTSTGDGLRLARDVGAAIVGQGSYIPTFGGLPPADGIRVEWQQRPRLVATERPPWEIYVDRAGRRFVAEDEPSIDAKERALADVPEMTFWMIFDAAAADASWPVVEGWERSDLDDRAGILPGVHRAADLTQLAALAGIDPDGLVASVAAYNAGVTTGRDALGRQHLPARIDQPPFYALRNHGVTLITFCGVDVDADLAVRRPDGSAVRGLYAAGEVLGTAATSGHAFCGGMLLTPALTFGRLLGRELPVAVDLSAP